MFFFFPHEYPIDLDKQYQNCLLKRPLLFLLIALQWHLCHKSDDHMYASLGHVLKFPQVDKSP